MAKLVYDYYWYDPYDSAELVEAYGGKEEALDGAIQQVRDRVRLYAMPCSWVAEWIGDTIRVRRIRHSPTGRVN